VCQSKERARPSAAKSHSQPNSPVVSERERTACLPAVWWWAAWWSTPNPYPIADLKSLPEHSGAQVLNVESEVAGGVAEHTRAVLDFFLSECQGFAIDLAQLGRGR